MKKQAVTPAPTPVQILAPAPSPEPDPSPVQVVLPVEVIGQEEACAQGSFDFSSSQSEVAMPSVSVVAEPEVPHVLFICSKDYRSCPLKRAPSIL